MYNYVFIEKINNKVMEKNFEIEYIIIKLKN